LLASEEERPVVQAVYQGVLGKNKVMNLSGALSLEELPAFISECGLLIANDGGPLHLAVFLGIPTLSLFGPTDERVYGPFLTGENRKNHSVLCVQAQCRPCYQGFRLKQCFKGYGCWETISPEQAFAAAKKLLNNSARDLNQEETHVEFRN
jgi:ADP-heptose:LPS heptosyltransferase